MAGEPWTIDEVGLSAVSSRAAVIDDAEQAQLGSGASGDNDGALQGELMAAEPAA